MNVKSKATPAQRRARMMPTTEALGFRWSPKREAWQHSRCRMTDEMIHAKRYKPKDALVVHAEDIPAIVYVSASIHANGKPCAIGYSFKRTRSDFNFRFRNDDHRAEYIARYFSDLRAAQAYKAQRKAERAAFRHDLKAGEILTYSWGYDQTQVDCFQVTRTTDKGVYLRPIGSKSTDDAPGPMAGYVVPCRDTFSGDEFFKRVTTGNLCMMDHGVASRWDGKPCYVSWYG